LHRDCLIKHLVTGKTERRIEVTIIGRRRHKQLLGDLKERRGCWKLKEEALINLRGELAQEGAMGQS
jgi:hypothetical protein